jgi:hypothetical protein
LALHLQFPPHGIILALYLPALYSQIFFEREENIYLLLSSVTKKLVYIEKAVAKDEEHHASILYRDSGRCWSPTRTASF